MQFVADKVQRQVARQEAGLLLTEDRTSDAEFQGFYNHHWEPEVIQLSHHFTLTFEAPVHFNGQWRVVSLLRLLSEFMSGRNIDCPVTREPRTRGSLG